jgi:hypothetical protein
MSGRKYFDELLVSKRNGTPIDVNSLELYRALISACSMFRSLPLNTLLVSNTVFQVLKWTGTGSILTPLLKEVIANMDLRHVRKGLKSPSLI